MEKLKIGMYLRCPIDKYNLECTVLDELYPRDYILGQAINIDEVLNKVTVTFYDIDDIKKYFSDIPRTTVTFDMDMVRHCRIKDMFKIKTIDMIDGEIICGSDEEDSYYTYYVGISNKTKKEIKLMHEDELICSFNGDNPNPVIQMIDYEFQNPKWYFGRQPVMEFMHVLRNATFGLDTLLGSRVLLFQHQIDTIIKGISETPCRLMLADEVGLGKTIEACVIMKGLKQKNGELRTLIIVPDSLSYQWQNELNIKFWLNISVFDNLSSLHDDLIFPIEKLNTPQGKKVLDKGWDLCIVDETHRLMNMDEEYKLIKDLSNKVSNLILISATPIQERKREYLSLLALLDPEHYSDMSVNEFDELVQKQEPIRNSINQMVKNFSNLSRSKVKKYLSAISRAIDDPIFNRIIEGIASEDEDIFNNSAKLAIAYVAEFYQLEKRIIRHRRSELEDKLAERDLYEIGYLMCNSGDNYYEMDVYDSLLKYLDLIIDNSGSDSVVVCEYIKIFLSAVFSSPWALDEVIDLRKKILKTGKTVKFEPNNFGMFTTPRNEKIRRENIFKSMFFLAGETDLLNEIKELNRRWMTAVVNEVNEFEDKYINADTMNGRFTKIIEYIRENNEKAKFVIFTSWVETAKKLEEIFKIKFGKDSVAAFHSDMNEDDLELSVIKFQESLKCRFMICDELGGEGRNFQEADEIIHVDLPWSPVQLEQRIGRLDRIGRNPEKKVLSVVPFAEGTIEEDLFKLWNLGLNIFNESLSGIEIVLGEIHGEIMNAFATDLRYGLRSVFNNISEKSEQMRESVSEERYFDMAKQLDSRTQQDLAELLSEYDGQDGRKLYNIMANWSEMVSLWENIMSDAGDMIINYNVRNINGRCTNNALYVPPDMTETHIRLKRLGEIKGTFSRNIAMKREDLVFFAPGEPLFDSILNNAKGCSRGKCISYYRRNRLIDWKGFILKWSIDINLKYLLDIGESIDNIALLQGYIPVNQITSIEPFDSTFANFDENIILEELEKGYDYDRCLNFGQRNFKPGHKNASRTMTNIEYFMNKFPYEVWKSNVKQVYRTSGNKAVRKIREMIDLETTRNDFERIKYGIKAAELYYGDKLVTMDSNRVERIYDALLKGLEDAKPVLDSIAFIWLVKKDD